ncbi:PREDICTED: uncharacterized protein LOC105455668 [Wasmannia auropunctata]|uniref:uncharacterized protein LOC105455668 n=1 Tax=Wasmannia auropunctata TaxID=64793 RepID=UPI0005EE59B2|nr:PREDICTED: uncharacterized protein LOC105455668 [Wasmannia auropunctata]XP_011697464.1 PREDICTED: uncharacterized protein LOC105455668 [Wasmannia auropunctata]
MYLKSCCALFLLALVACQAAPLIEKKSISEADTFAKANTNQMDTGIEKARAKKSITTFCMEVHEGKPEKVPCKSEPQKIGQPDISNPVFLVQPVPVPAPVPAPAPVQAPAPAAFPIINIVSSAPGAAPCDKPTNVHTSSPQLYAHHLIHPPSQPTPPVTSQEAKLHKEAMKLLKPENIYLLRSLTQAINHSKKEIHPI